jgi:phosphoserine phosphatase
VTAPRDDAGPDRETLRSWLPSWGEGPATRSLVTFLAEATQGPGAVPVEQRIAAFDNDGTLACEKPETALAAFLRDRSALPTLGAHDTDGSLSGHEVLRRLAALCAGTTTEDYDTQASEFLATARHPRFGRPYPTLTYRPMLELIAVLQRLQFRVYLCSDTSRDFLRTLAGPAYGLARDQVIGSEVRIRWQDGQLIRSATPLPLDDGPGKPVHIWDRTGARPLLAAGNAVGDIEMLEAARHALVVHHDDPVREYAYDDPQILTAAARHGWTVLSMRRDFTDLWSHPLPGHPR